VMLVMYGDLEKWMTFLNRTQLYVLEQSLN
jgi:hypothetical protein